MKIKRAIIAPKQKVEREFELTRSELEMAHDEFIETYGNDPLLDFIKDEVPFRLAETIGLSQERITEELVEQLVDNLYEHSDIMFNYDRIDEWLRKQIAEYEAKNQ